MERAVVIYTTFPGLVEAERVGRALVERLVWWFETIRELHSYEVPAIAAIPLESVERHYLGWQFGATGPDVN